MGGMTDRQSADGLSERIRALVPWIAEHAEQAERERKPVDEVITALKGTGVFKAFVPRRFGGYELGPEVLIDVGVAIGGACASTAWVTTFYMEHNWMLAQFPQETQLEVFGHQPYILAAASIAPTGRATQSKGGYVLTGRWAWGTGVMHADWVLLNGMVKVKGKDEKLDLRLFLVPRDQIKVDEDWDSAGMSGTGSNDMLAEEIFVPAARSESIPGMGVGRGSGALWHGSSCYRVPMVPLLGIAAAAPAVGAARRAVELFKERLGSRTIYGTINKQAERGSSQIRLAHADVRVASAEVLLRDVGRELASLGESEEICPPEERARMRLQIAHTVEICRDVVRSVMEASGASAHLRPHPMQRIHRDVHALSCHTVFDLDLGAENYGRLLLGIDPVSPV